MPENFNNDKFYYFLEHKLIKIFLGTIFLILVINKVLLIYTELGWTKLDAYFLLNLRTTLEDKDSTLITIAAVFIGIYFTIFTLLSSVKIESTFTILTKNNFEKLLSYIRNAFIGSFVYLLFSLFSSTISNQWVWTLIGLMLLLYMLFSALRFGLIIYMIFSRDFKKYYDHLEKERNQKRELENLAIRLGRFLDEHEAKTQREYSQTVSDLLAKKNNTDSKKK